MKKLEKLLSMSATVPGSEKLHPIFSNYWHQIQPRPDTNSLIINMEAYAVLISGGKPGPNRNLYVSYDFMRPDRSKRQHPVFWGASFMEKRGYAGIAIYPRQNCWYKIPSLRKLLLSIRDTGWFDTFDRRITYGASMGASGALWHADAVQADTVIAFSPQVCMDEDVFQRGDRRFPAAMEMNWDRNEIRERVARLPEDVDIIGFFDNRFDLDRMHMELMSEVTDHRARLVRLPYVGHSTIGLLARSGFLSKIMDAATEGRIDDGLLKNIRDTRKRYRPWLKHLQLHNMQRTKENQSSVAAVLGAHLSRKTLIGRDKAHRSHSRWLGRQASMPKPPLTIK